MELRTSYLGLSREVHYDSDSDLVLGDTVKDLLIGLCHRVAYAGALSLGVFDLTVLPLGLPSSGLLSHSLMLLNLPAALVYFLLPYEWHGLDFPLGPGSQTGARLFWNHMLISIPAYVCLFYVVGLLWAGLQRVRDRREPPAKLAARS